MTEGIPTQGQMDMNDPKEHVLWGLVNFGGHVGAPLILPKKIMEELSRHLYRCGFRHHPEVQEIWYKPPGEGDSIWDGTGGQWVEGPEPGVSPKFYSDEEVADRLIESLPPEVLARIREGGDSNGGSSGR